MRQLRALTALVTLTFSGPATAGAHPAPVARTHAVAKGETLRAIARRYHTTSVQLASLNDLDDPDRILAGQRLAVPGPPIVCPVQGRRVVADNFGHPREGDRVHMGNDIFAPRGAPVVAPVAGTVTHVQGPLAGFGFYLFGADEVTYFGAHLDRYARGPGRVGTGEVLGQVGNSGNARNMPSHLHFVVKPGGGPAVDPNPILRQAC